MIWTRREIKLPKLPALQFYVGDLVKDPNYRSLTLEEKGMYIEVLTLLHEQPIRGVFRSKNGRAWSLEQVACAITGATVELAQSLIDKGVIRRSTRGIMWQKRMLRDEMTRRRKARAGHNGGIVKPFRKRKAKGKQTLSKPGAPPGVDRGSSVSPSGGTEPLRDSVPPPVPASAAPGAAAVPASKHDADRQDERALHRKAQAESVRIANAAPVESYSLGRYWSGKAREWLQESVYEEIMQGREPNIPALLGRAVQRAKD